ncbi:MAG TPA: aspartate/glutamate racemase family protein, partial [Tissierellaceae bacterium]|nr:aspartate/glutamate racemase family protein [Tissierellaceae bacterium]
MIHKVKKDQVFYGQGIGIITLDYTTPFIPGDVGNASTFNFPVRYQTVKDFTVTRMYAKDMTGLDEFIEAGKQLAKDGVKAITGNCGYLALFQKEIANELDVPVFMSSLLQIPFMASMLKDGEKIGVLVANKEVLDPSLLKAVGVSESTPLVIKGMENREFFYKAVIEEVGTLDSDKVEEEVVSEALKMVQEDPSIKLILLECTCMPPYAAAVQRATGRPIFDFVTMINCVYSRVVRTE